MTDNVYTSDVTVDTATPSQLVESIRLREERIAENIDELVGRVHPKVLVNRALTSAKSTVIDDDGSPKIETIALAVGAVLGLGALVIGLGGKGKRG